MSAENTRELMQAIDRLNNKLAAKEKELAKSTETMVTAATRYFAMYQEIEDLKHENLELRKDRDQWKKWCGTMSRTIWPSLARQIETGRTGMDSQNYILAKGWADHVEEAIRNSPTEVGEES